MEKNNDILHKIDRRSGMTVPEGYFAGFASRMAASLPDKPADQTPVMQRTFWQKIRPYAYMAAMFAGIWCMMKMFQMMGSGSADLSIDNYPGVITALNNDNFVKDYVFPSVNEYDLLEDIYETGFDADEFFGADSIVTTSDYQLELPAEAFDSEPAQQI